MQLVVDIGNTTEKAALFKGDTLIQVYKPGKIDAKILEEIIGENSISAWIISSVTNVRQELSGIFSQYAKGIVFDHTTPLPVVNSYATPETLGKDRLANVIGAWKLMPGTNVLVVDAGTCIKCDFISSEGKYLGGSISPGLAMRFKAMHNFTAMLPHIPAEKYNAPVSIALTGNSTETALIAGGAMGAVFEVQKTIDEYHKIYDNLKVILTGGDALFFDYHMKNRIFALPDLTLIGLNTVLEYNSRNFNAN